MKLKIAILGSRGIPNRYGGFEQCAEYLAKGLVDKGHEVSVYNVHHHDHQEKIYKGVNIVHCKDWEPQIGTAGQFIYDLNCILHSRKQDYDIVLQLGYTSSSVWGFLWKTNCIQAVNMDGLEWKRSKYSSKVQKFLKKAEAWAVKRADVLIADNEGIQDYLRDEYAVESECIAYGSEITTEIDHSLIQEYGLKEYSYDMVLARMEPENSISEILEAYIQSKQERKLVLVGKLNEYAQSLELKYQQVEGVEFLGGIYKKEKIDALRASAALYLHGHTVGGTNPSLLEAMALGCTIVAKEVSFNKLVLEDGGQYFQDADSLAQTMNSFSRNNNFSNREKNLEKIRNKYSWAQIVDAYEASFLKAVNKP